MKATISFVQTMQVECISCHKTELRARMAYDNSPDVHSIMCAKGLDRCYWLVMNRQQHEAYLNKLKQLRDIMKE